MGLPPLLELVLDNPPPPPTGAPLQCIPEITIHCTCVHTPSPNTHVQYSTHERQCPTRVSCGVHTGIAHETFMEVLHTLVWLHARVQCYICTHIRVYVYYCRCACKQGNPESHCNVLLDPMQCEYRIYSNTSRGFSLAGVWLLIKGGFY